MSELALEALVAIVERETVMARHDLAKYGELQCDPKTPAFQELVKRYEAQSATTPPTPAPSPEPGDTGLWICPETKECTVSGCAIHGKPHKHTTNCGAAMTCPACVPVSAPAEPAPVDVGDEYERVPVGTMITDTMEYYNHRNGEWIKTRFSGDSVCNQPVYRRRKPQPQYDLYGLISRWCLDVGFVACSDHDIHNLIKRINADCEVIRRCEKEGKGK